jgi:hypothetical protein
MDEQTKELLYSIADGIFNLLAENEKLQAENEELRAYKERRVEMDFKHLQIQVDTFGDIMQRVCDQKRKQYRIYFKTIDGNKQKTDAVFDDKFDANQRCFYLNDNVAILGQYVYEEEYIE